MAMTLERVLNYASLAAAEPRVVAGLDGMSRLVRWIHSSEVLEIAPLLRGGELLLTGGDILAEVDPAAQRRYVRELAERRVTGVAIETGEGLPTVPAAIIEEANSLRFPVIELGRQVAFVEVAEQINGALVHESVTGLRHVAELTHALSGVVADGGGVHDILEAFGERTGAAAMLVDSSGQQMASVGQALDASGDTLGGGPADLRGAITSRVILRGIHAATVVVSPGPDADVNTLGLAASAVAESVGLALLRIRPPSARDFAAGELVRLAATGRPRREQVQRLGQDIGFAAAAPVIGLVGVGGVAGLSRLDVVLRNYGRTAIDTPASNQSHALVSLRDQRSPAASRRQLIADLDGASDQHEPLVVVVGPVLPTLYGAPTSLAAAIETLGLLDLTEAMPATVDVEDHALERLLMGAERARLERLRDERLAMFAPLPARSRDRLLSTLETYFESGCSKTATAQRLGVTRQTLYGRLDRAFGLLGVDPTGTASALSLYLALRLRHLERGRGGCAAGRPL